MQKSDKKEKRKMKVSAGTIFTVPYSSGEIKESITIDTKSNTEVSKESIINNAFKFHSQGNIDEASKYYQYFINKGFQDHRAFSNYGVILKNLGKLKEAEIYLNKAIELKPDFADAHLNLGKILIDLGKLKEAEISLSKAIKLKPDFANAHFNLGNTLNDLGKFEEAEISLRKAIEFQEVEISISKEIELKPDFADAYLNLANILKNLGKLHEAEKSLRQAIALKPDFAIAYFNLGNVLSDLGKLKEAEISLRKAIKVQPDYANAYSNLGIILKDLDKLEEAEIYTRKAIELKPDFTNAHFNLGNTLSELGKFQEAEISLRKTIKLQPDHAEAYANLAQLELLNGNYQSGLENYEFRFKTKRPPITHGKTKLKRIESKKLPKGEKLLIISEQGLGDTLQYMRYIPYLRRQGFDVSFSAQTKLHSLIQSSDIDQNPLTPETVCQVPEGQWIPLLSIPRYLKISPKNPIIVKPYINSTDELNQKWKNIFSTEKKPIIGINWQGNPNIENTYQGRSIQLETFSKLFEDNQITMISLQKGFGSEQLNHCSFKNKFIKCQPQIDSTWDFLENAAIIKNCDLIITCDTSIAHLAGGMGKKVWLLLRNIPFWTWGVEGDKTFWYPSMRLFRQKERHNWDEVMKRVSNQLTIEEI